MQTNGNHQDLKGESESIHDLISSKISQLELKSDEKSSKKLVNKKELKETRQFLLGILEDDQSGTEEKLRLLSAKFVQLLQKVKQLEKEVKTKNSQNEQLIKEKGSLRGELEKTNAVKGRLESLCRTLQEDHKRRLEEEQERRQELADSFQSKLQHISEKVDGQADERILLWKENEMMKEKIRNLTEQYKIREKHFEIQAKTKDLELQLLEAKVKQQNQVYKQDTVKATSRIELYEEQIESLTKTDGELRGQLSLYAEKFEQFQDTLSKSNDVFNTFKQEMDRMTKTIKKNEKENASLKKKCEQTDIALINFVEERNQLVKQLETVTNQKRKLEDLCRALRNNSTKEET